MMRPILKRVAAICAVTMVFAMLAACGSDRAGQTGVEENEAQNEQENQNEGENQSSDDCDSNDDCEGDQVCVRSEPGAAGECRDTDESRGIGESCTDSEQCASGLCYEGECASECGVQSDCPDGWLCIDRGDVALCEEPTSCASDSDCEADSTRCVVDREEDVTVTCGPPAGEDELGDDCSADDDCAAGLCLDGQCSRPCESPSDCGDVDQWTCSGEDLGDGEEVTVCVDRPPEGCLSDEECSGDDRCVARTREEEVKFVCGEPNDGGAEGAESCEDDSDCAQNLCVDGACAEPCDGDEVCESAAGSRCVTESVEREDAEGTVSVCDVPAPCDLPGDCAEDEACGFAVSTDGEGLETVCFADNGGNDPGAVCEDHGDCRSRYCLDDGICSGVCGDREDCGNYQLCQEETTFDKDGTSDQVQACTELPVTECMAPVDCEYDDTTCNRILTDDEDNLESGGCGFTNPEQEPLAAECTAADECTSDFCWFNDDESGGECSVFCEETDRDCADEQVCATMAQEMGACLTSCQRNADCDGGNVCHHGVTTDGNSINQYCDIKVGDGATGDVCSDGSECETGLCVTMSVYDVTDTSCNADGDCDADFECRCPPGEPGCTDSENVCVSQESNEEESRCSELCDAGNGDADCESDENEMSVCSDSVVVTWDEGNKDDVISACVLPQEQ